MSEKPDDSTVTVSKEWLSTLYRSHRFLQHLEAAGVDNWDGYGYARVAMREEEEEDADEET